MACNLNALIEQAKCLQCVLVGDMYAAAEIALLCALRDGEPMSCDPQTLAAQANCIRACIPVGMFAAVRTALLCDIANIEPPPAPSTQLFIERFEAPDYDLSGWIEIGAAGNILDPDYTGVVLEGAQSLRIRTDTLTACNIRRLITPLSRVFVFFQFELISSSSPETFSIITVVNTGGVIVAAAGIDMNTSNFYVQAAGTVVSLAAVLLLNTKYYCWFEYNKNNGANRFASFGASTTPVRPTAAPDYAEAVSVINALDVDTFSFGVVSTDGAATDEIVMDRIIADSVQIGNNP